MLGLVFIGMLSYGCATSKNKIQFLPNTYEHDVTKWVTVSHPVNYNSREGNIWYFSAAYFPDEWFVYKTASNVCAILRKEQYQNDQAQPIKVDRTKQGQIMLEPPFTPKAENFQYSPVPLQVNDGWLIGFDDGDWGAALYWFSPDGNSNYKISNHQIVQFLMLSGRIYAIEGLAHLGYSRGSFITIEKKDNKWNASTVKVLDSAPCAAVVLDGKALICVLTDSLIKIDMGGLVTTIYKPAKDCGYVGLYPTSVAVSHDKKYVYIGMRQFVAEVTMDTGTLRYLIPSKVFLNKLTKEQLKYNIGNQYK